MASAVAGTIAGSIGSSLLSLGADLLTKKGKSCTKLADMINQISTNYQLPFSPSGESSTWQLPNGVKISELNCWQVKLISDYMLHKVR